MGKIPVESRLITKDDHDAKINDPNNVQKINYKPVAETPPAYLEIKGRGQGAQSQPMESTTPEYMRHYEDSGRPMGSIKTQRIPEEWKSKRLAGKGTRKRAACAESAYKDENLMGDKQLFLAISAILTLSFAIILAIGGGIPYIVQQMQEFQERVNWLDNDDE